MYENLKRGTTTMGIVCKDGLVLAADRRASAGYMVADKKTKKVIKINDNLAITTAGLVSDIQLLTKLLRAQLKLTEIRRGRTPSTKQAANLLAGMVYHNVRRLSMIPSIVGFLVGGKDSSGFHLYNLGIDGSISEADDYLADGSGTQFALGVMEANFKKDMTIQEGVNLAVKTMNVAMQRDIATGNGIDVLTLTKEGVKTVLERELKVSL